MSYGKARKLLLASLVSTLLLGACIVLFSFVWVPAGHAHAVDAILDPRELRDRKLIEVVSRTLRYDEQHKQAIVAPFRALGAFVVLSAVAGLIALREVPRPLEPGIIGMREES